MDLTFASGPAHESDVDLLAVLVDDPAQLPPSAEGLDELLGGALTRELARGQVKADAPSIVIVTGAATGPGRVALVGHGPDEDGRADALRVAASKVAGAARAAEARTIAIIATDAPEDIDAIVTGFELGAFRIHKHRSEATPRPEAKDREDADPVARYDGPLELHLHGDEGTIGNAARRAHEVALAQNWARDLANAPANLLMPEVLAETARTMAGE
ncbi:MAG: cytosol aminopeptidase, partial [Thermoleophilia bacterium]|nr:cytosol aminopeptidase [Thermoleophilia bacterium]